ncbi:MAG: SRPBCC family protein [Pirellulales bacterium]
MVKWILIVLGVLLGIVAVLAIVVALQPAEFVVERSLTMAAPPDVVFDQVNDFHKWQAWSPWAKLDPDAQNTFEGPDSGEGAKFAWSGNNDVGEGNMTIVESRRPEQIKIDLRFVRPFEDQADTLFSFAPTSDGTQVTWRMSGTNNFVGKAMCLVVNMDTMVGGDFDKGLAAMKEIAEAQASGASPGDAQPTEEEIDGGTEPELPAEAPKAEPEEATESATENEPAGESGPDASTQRPAPVNP